MGLLLVITIGFTAGLNTLSIFLTVLSLLVCIGFVYAGVRMRDLLASNPGRIEQLIFANVAVQLVYAGLGLSVGDTQNLPRIGLVLAISGYLLWSVRRLAAQVAIAETPAEAA
jgi:hypothetical protein